MKYRIAFAIACLTACVLLFAAEPLLKSDKDRAEGALTSDIFKRLDKNGDGKLTPDELSNPEWFAKLDLNKDGVITLEEAIKAIGEHVPQRYLAGVKTGGSSSVPHEDESLKEQPKLIKATENGVGRLVADVELKNAQGGDAKLFDTKANKALVVGLFSASCPISNKLGPELARIEKDYSDKGVSFVWVDVIANEKSDEMQKFVNAHGLKSTRLHDADASLSKALQATTTTEVFVLDAAHTLVYRGAVNDQYGLGYAKESAKKNYLRDALEATLRGEVPAIAATTAPGCALDSPKDDKALVKSAVTYHNQIARILNANCVECHHSNGIAPFALTSYEEVIEHAGMIRKQVERGTMPPWFAGKEFSGAHHVFMNDRSLPDEDRTDLIAWLNSDRAKGDAALAPLPRQFATEWAIGKPDLILQIAKAIPIKAEGIMPYQHAVIETFLPEDRWVQSYQIMPTAREVVHHVIVSIQTKDGKNNHENGIEGFFASYVPGNDHRILPDGFGRKLPAGAKIIFNIHYTPTGKATTEQMRLGLVFAKQPPQYEVHVSSVANPRLNIPAGASDHVEVAQRTLPTDMMLMSYMPHMHVRGKAFKYEVTTPDGKTETLLDVPRYDFNWQLLYTYAQPKFLPAGSVVKTTAIFDNSANNPANPDPTKNVRWGLQTYEEMMIGYVEFYVSAAVEKVAASGK